MQTVGVENATMRFFLPLVKADQEKRLVYARAAAEEPDKAGEIMDYATAVPAFRAWSKTYEDATMGKSFGNVRAMHNPRHLAGKVEKLDFDDEGKVVGAMIKVLDPTDWIKVEEGGYTGISIGGGYAKKWPDPLNKNLTRYTPRIQEISFVDSPCIPSARILEMTKMDGTTEEILLKGTPHTFAELVAPRTFGDLNKIVLPVALGLGGMILGHKLGRTAGGLAGLAATRRMGPGTAAAAIGGGAVGGYAGLAGGWKTGRHLEGGDEAALKRRRDGSIAARKQQLLGALAKQAAAARNEVTAVRNEAATARNEAASDHNLEIEGDVSGLLKAAQGKAPATPEAKEKIRQTLHEFKRGALRSYRGVNPRTGKPRRGPKVENRQQAIAIALSQARRMGKAEDAGLVLMLTGRLEKAIPREKTGAAVGGVLGAGLGARYGGPIGAAIGGMVGARHGGRIGQAIDQRRAQLARTSGKGALTDKEHAQRIAAAKARWASEGHPGLDDHHEAVIAQAKKAILGRAGKVAAAIKQHDQHWHAVADAMDAYDKVKPHMRAGHHLMMTVGGTGLLYNPEGVGEKHFNDHGEPKQPLYMLHHTEADDWIAKHGKNAKKVTKETPLGLVEHIDELVAAAMAEAA